MSLRRFIALLISLALALTPLGMPAAAAGPGPAHHHMTAGVIGSMGAMGDCAGKMNHHQPNKGADKGCCAATCVGVAVTPSIGAAAFEFSSAAFQPAAGPYLNGIPSELPTPPPRSA